MSGLDIWAAAAAFVAGSAIAVRARMLRPHAGAWTSAPMVVWLGLSALALGLLMIAASLWFGARANAREAVVYTLLAAVAVVMLWNLNRHGRAAELRRREIAAEVATVLEVTPPPARYPWERRG